MTEPSNRVTLIEAVRVVRKPRMGEMVEIEFCDGEILILDPEIFVKNGLGTGDCLTMERLADIQKQQTLLMARRRLVLYLQTHRKTEAEAAEYLRKLRYAKDAITYAVDAAKYLGLLNDKLYAEQFTKVRSENRKQGILLVRHELKARGVNPDLIHEATTPVADHESQLEQARLAIAKRAANMTGLDKQTRYRRLSGFLARRGFTGNIVAQVLREVIGNTPEDTTED